MIITYEGILTSAPNVKIAIISSRFNSLVTDKLVAGALDALKRHNFTDKQITLYKVPGAFELPVTVNKIINRGGYDGIIALGAVIRGETPHFDYVAAEVSKGLANISIKNHIPLGLGILTTDNMDQALNRAGGKAGNKGAEAALTVIEMINLFSQI